MLVIPEEIKAEIRQLWPDYREFHRMLDQDSPQLLPALEGQVLECYAAVLTSVEALSEAPDCLGVLQSTTKLFRARLELYQKVKLILAN